MPGSVAFLFMDESAYAPLDLAALTGFLVPAERYKEVRDEICQVVWEVLRPPERTIPQPIELHARNLLSQIANRNQPELDLDRLNVLGSAVRIINKYGLEVFRVAYLNRKEICDLQKGDPNLYGLNFFGMLCLLQAKLADKLILPVMDGVPGCPPQVLKPPAIDPQLIRAFAKMVRFRHHARGYPGDQNSIRTQDNIENLAEPVFADSEHSTLLQLTDLVSYLLLQLDREEMEPSAPKSPFRTAVINHARGIDPSLLHCWKDKMVIHRGDNIQK